ncbi:SDR family oxidoreductase [Glycocaulis sp.]|uniref:SDR family oxidoreductase n=1 Tax=Glycocaulis sp. TaxID=1969725 RepID=UPI003D1EBDF2
MKIRLKPLSQQTIVITGGSSGIGLCTARLAAEEGARVVIISRNEEALTSVVEQIKASGGEADYIVADVGDRDAMRDAVDTVIERHGGFDTWVNNAGVGIYATLEETSDEDHHRIFQTNYWGVVYGSLEALRHLKERGGALINIGSISSEMPAPILSAYTASKFAVKGFTDSLRLELMHEKAPVAVTLIKPSGIHTPFGEHAKNYMTARSQVPPPVYHPKLVAKAILHCAEHPTRDVLVGASGFAQTMMAKFMPGLSDRLFSWAFYKTALDENLPKRNAPGLHNPGSDGKELGDQDDPILEVSPYTAAQLHPKATFAIGAGIAALAAALVIKRKEVGKLVKA